MTTQTVVSGVTLSAASWANDVDTATYSYLTGVAGTNTVTATGAANLTYAAGIIVRWIPAATNTGATTINITPSGASALGARNVFFNGAACTGGEMRIGVPCQAVDDGTRLHLLHTGFSNTYTPTLTNTTNLDGSTAYVCQYIRVGNSVIVSGQVDVDPTAGGSITLGISLPIASNLASTTQCAGTANSSAVADSYAIQGDSTNDRATLTGIASTTSNNSLFFTFTYLVI